MVFQAIADSFVNSSSLEMLLMLMLGTILGLLFGSLPGLSSVSGCALVLPFTYGMDSLQAMLIFAGVISVSPLGGSIPAILLNTPGTPQNVATCFDGFPMCQRGEPSRSIAISTFINSSPKPPAMPGRAEKALL